VALAAQKSSVFSERLSNFSFSFFILFSYFIIFIYFFNIKILITGVMCMYAPQKRVRMIDNIRSNILDKTHIKDKELAKQIAREWIRKARGGLK